VFFRMTSLGAGSQTFWAILPFSFSGYSLQVKFRIEFGDVEEENAIMQGRRTSGPFRMALRRNAASADAAVRQRRARRVPPAERCIEA
jgi:hypothetical protein